MPTSLSRLVSGNAVTKSMIVPCSIHSETIIRFGGETFAPNSCNRFGCLNCFHMITSRQNSYSTLISTPRLLNRTKANGHTFCKLVRSIELTRRTLIATLEPRYAPRHTSALVPLPQGYLPIHFNSSVIVYEVGSCLCSRHIFLSMIENLF